MRKGISNWWNDAKFDYSIKAIFIFAVIVSFSHTIELYSSVGFNVEIKWLNNLLRVDFITLALFATLAAEAAFAVGLWGLYEAYGENRKFPNVKEYWQVWTLFGCGLIVVGWSNVGGTVGYDFLIGQPFKGIALGLSIPLFVLGAVLVNFKRKQTDESEKATPTQENDEQTTTQSGKQEEQENFSAIIATKEEEKEIIFPVSVDDWAETSTQVEKEETPVLDSLVVENLDKKAETTQPEKKEERENSPIMEDQEKDEIPTVKTDDDAEEKTAESEQEKEREEIATEDMEKVASPAEDDDQEKNSNEDPGEETKSKQETDKEKEVKQPASLEEMRDELARVEKIARDIWKKEGKRPGRVKIETETNCSEKTSRKIAKKLLEEEKRKAKAS